MTTTETVAGSSKLEESSEAGAGRVWRRLRLDPQQLTQWNLNLRLVSTRPAPLARPPPS